MKVLMISNQGMGFYKFNQELTETLIENGNEVFVTFPKDEYADQLEALGCSYIHTRVDRRGTNPIRDLKLLLSYLRILRRIKPAIVLTFTIKPNIYGGIACRLTNTPYIANITGLGSSIHRKGFLQKLTLHLYKTGLKKCRRVFFQNKSDRDYFTGKKIAAGNSKVIPGSGVNLKQFPYVDYPPEEEPVRLLYLGRIMKEKGIDELLEAAEKVKKQYPDILFELAGCFEDDYSRMIRSCQEDGIINYYGQQEDIHPFLIKSHALILPSYHEGLANVLLEAASTGRPVLASEIAGCREAFDEESSGIGFEPHNADSLTDAIVKFIKLPYEKKQEMGLAGRIKMETEFDRQKVVNAYMEELRQLKG